MAKIPDGCSIQATHSIRLNLLGILEQAGTTYIFSRAPYWSHPITRCIVWWRRLLHPEKQDDQIDQGQNNIMTGDRNINTGMWELDIAPPQPLSTISSQMLPNQNSFSIITRYYVSVQSKQHGWQPLKIFFKSWLGLTPELVNKYFDKPINTNFGHLKQTW